MDTPYKLNQKIRQNRYAAAGIGFLKSDPEHKPCLLKIFNKAALRAGDLAQLKIDYSRIQKIESEKLLKTTGWMESEEEVVILWEDFDGLPLKIFQSRHSLDMKVFLRIAIQMAEAIADLHKQNLVHGRISPHTIFIREGDQAVRSWDYGLLSVLNRENGLIYDKEILEQNLPYISPEQSGRMNRTMDYRTDFYSLGVVFYEMLAGNVPFESTDPLEIIHGHIAKKVRPPVPAHAKIPAVISEIVMMLLSKNAEERYQSAYGLRLDLEKCLAQLEETGAIEPFNIAQHDVSDRFQIPQKLYGREEEIRSLLSVFERVSRGATDLMLISGYPGIGKTALVHEIHKPIVEQKGYFISGKYEQLQKDVPYNAIIQAFRDLAGQILTESEERIQMWREKLSRALGGNGQLIVDVVPKVELILGRQPSVPSLPPQASESRFNMTFQKFVRVFAQADHPLTIFLDDVQWVDSASLNLIRSLLCDPDTKYLFMIASYRNNEVDNTHPLMQAVGDMAAHGLQIGTIAVAPLKPAYITQLLADTLKCSLEKAEPLSRLVYRKSDGNPFFVGQLLKTWYDEHAVRFDPQSGWLCDTRKIHDLQIPDDVAQLMASKMKKFAESTQQVLKLASCIGHQFDLTTLATVYEKSLTDAYQDLQPSIEEGLVLVSGENYQFLHDRIQEAAYSMIPQEDKERMHYQIGRLVLQQIKEEELSEKLFYVVDQLDIGMRYVQEKGERTRLIRLNLQAGKKAKASGAYNAALRFFGAGMSLLSSESWNSDYPLTFLLYLERSECEYLSGNFDQAEELFDVLLKNARTSMEKAEVYKIKATMYLYRGKPREAIRYGMEGLKCLKFGIPESAGKMDVLKEVLRVKFYIGLRRPEDLLNLPRMSAPNYKMITDILSNILPAAYYLNENLFSVLMMRMLTVSLRFGNTATSVIAYATYGTILGSIFGNYKEGKAFAEMALKLSEQFNDLWSICEANFAYGAFINHWHKHVRTDMEFLTKGATAGFDSGNFVYAGYCVGLHVTCMALKGDPVSLVQKKVADYLESCRRVNNTDMFDAISSTLQYILALKGETRAPGSFSDQQFIEEDYVERLLKQNRLFVVSVYQSYKLPISYLFGEYQEALKIAKEMQKNITRLLGMVFVPLHSFYYSLTLTALYPQENYRVKRIYWQILTKNQCLMRKWAANCPENYRHQYLLVEAEIARLTGRENKAIDLYDQAIAGAKKNEFVQDEALSCELAAKFYLGQEREMIARFYLTEARALYARWGALGKLKSLEREYPQLMSEAATRPVFTGSPDRAEGGLSSAGGVSTMDLTTVLKSSQTISQEIFLDRLLSKLMRIVMENAGAQKGFLILENEGKLLIEAQSSSEKNEVAVMESIPIESSADLSVGIIQYLRRTRENLVLNDAAHEGMFTTDPYVLKNRPKSILCFPIIKQNQLLGMLYLENNLTKNAFTPERIEILKLLSTQAAISLENAKLYKKLDRQLQELRDMYDLQKKFTSTVSHELRTPLAMSKQAVSLLQREKTGVLNEKQKEIVKVSSENIERLNVLINNLLDFSDLEDGKMELNKESVDITALVRENCAQWRAKAAVKMVHLDIQLPEKPVELVCDRARFLQVLSQLIDNAVKFTPEQGAVKVVVMDRGREVECTVKDTGPGISEEELPRIFDKFQQLNRTYRPGLQGTGLGLNIVSALVQLHGGRITVESREGEGSVFSFVIPRDQSS